MRVEAVVKVGGSLLGDARLRALVGVLGELSRTRSLVVVPGGGPFADSVRCASAVLDPGPSAAHWMAILAMDQHAHLLAGLLPASRLVESPGGIAEAVAAGALPILAPSAWLRAADPLPHGWHVTSDSIAAWVAGRVSAERLVLLKALDGVPNPEGGILTQVELGSPGLRKIVDGYFTRAKPPGLETWILSGHHPERLAELLSDGRTHGTQIGRGRSPNGGHARGRHSPSRHDPPRRRSRARPGE
jgi:aspartokinase-like uncharacterized kinase